MRKIIEKINNCGVKSITLSLTFFLIISTGITGCNDNKITQQEKVLSSSIPVDSNNVVKSFEPVHKKKVFKSFGSVDKWGFTPTGPMMEKRKVGWVLTHQYL